MVQVCARFARLCGRELRSADVVPASQRYRPDRSSQGGTDLMPVPQWPCWFHWPMPSHSAFAPWS